MLPQTNMLHTPPARLRLLLSMLLLSSFSITACSEDAKPPFEGAEACDTLTLSTEERAIYDRIMEERAKVGLGSIPVSASLTYVARAHARDSSDHYAKQPEGCNLHSWSNHGNWKGCCYTSDHANAACMWEKPREMTTFPGEGYEISAVGSHDPVSMWMKSDGHRAVILNERPWAIFDFKSIGIGITANANGQPFAHVWFAPKGECQ